MSKLKRQRKRKDPLPNLNDSDDFVSTASSTRSSRSLSQPGAPSSTPASDSAVEAVSVTTSDPQRPSASVSFPCPLCRKPVSDEAGHLKVRYNLQFTTAQSSFLYFKVCGARLGLTTQQMVEVRRLEERHREDRRRLGLPDILPPPATGVKQRSAGGRRRAADREEVGADPDLELALALSISASAGRVVKDDEPAEVADDKEPVKREGKMWLPQAPPPQSLTTVGRKRGKLKKGVITVLQSRTEEERQRLLGERVAKVLEEATLSSPRSVDNFGRVGMLWSLAGRLDCVSSSQLIVETFKHLMQSNITAQVKKASIDSPVKADQSSGVVSESDLCLRRQWLDLLRSGAMSDVRVQCQEEVTVTCHSLVLHVRCPAVLDRAVREDDRSYILILDSYSSLTVTAVLEFVYGGMLQEASDKHVVRLMREWGLETRGNVRNEKKLSEVKNSNEATNVTSTQCLDALIDCLEDVEKSREIEKEEEERVNNESEDFETIAKSEADEEIEAEEDEWQEMVHYMTQRKISEVSLNRTSVEQEVFVNIDSAGDLKKDDDDHYEPVASEFHLKEPESESSYRIASSQGGSTLNRSSSPDMFESDDDEEDNELDEEMFKEDSVFNNVSCGVKRKPESASLQEESNLSKRHCVEDLSVRNDEEVIDLTQGESSSPPVHDHHVQINPLTLLEPALEELIEIPSSKPEDIEDEKNNDEPDSENLIIKLSRLSSELTDSSKSETELVAVLVELAQLEVTVPALLATGAGKVVKRMKGTEGKVGRLAARLVVRWKWVVINYDGGETEATKDNQKNCERSEKLVNKQASKEPSPEREVGNKSKDLLNQTGLGHDKPYSEDTEDDIPEPLEEPPPPCSLSQQSPSVPPDNMDYCYDDYIPPPEFDPIPEEEFGSCPEEEFEPLPEELPNNVPVAADHFLEDVPHNFYQEDTENIPPAASSSMSPRTPVTSSRSPAMSRLRRPAPVTPLPDYTAMLTPQLRAELKRFGLKAVPRRKACLLLNHIYEQTHPLVPCTPRPPPPARKLITDPEPEEKVTEDSDDDQGSQMTESQDMPEESILYDHEEAEEDEPPLTQVSGATLHDQLTQFVKARRSFYQMILLYEPVWLGQLHRDVKEAGIKCTMTQLQVLNIIMLEFSVTYELTFNYQDWLDLECITYRTESNRNKNKAAAEKRKKKMEKSSQSARVK